MTHAASKIYYLALCRGSGRALALESSDQPGCAFCTGEWLLSLLSCPVGPNRVCFFIWSFNSRLLGACCMRFREQMIHPFLCWCRHFNWQFIKGSARNADNTTTTTTLFAARPCSKAHTSWLSCDHGAAYWVLIILQASFIIAHHSLTCIILGNAAPRKWIL